MYPQSTQKIFNLNNECPSGIPYIHPVDAIAALEAKSEQIGNMTTELNNLVDGGDTPAALNKVAGLAPRNFNRVSFELLQYASYLSDTVLVSYMQTPVNGHFIPFSDIK